MLNIKQKPQLVINGNIQSNANVVLSKMWLPRSISGFLKVVTIFILNMEFGPGILRVTPRKAGTWFSPRIAQAGVYHPTGKVSVASGNVTVINIQFLYQAGVDKKLLRMSGNISDLIRVAGHGVNQVVIIDSINGEIVLKHLAA
ncbi:hypothetical protein C2E25_12450 [Geothermobacter hydrogeniphilus]|uniref:Uncharacterized protein n=1 Tax=Geothermobacter hydrogeniphilus TaxID=1969733 RepID=A0A2K2H828_9BACT|nr:hypothetical protein C2E25_12450 [Geothermobacter hydrogeniphilus]